MLLLKKFNRNQADNHFRMIWSDIFFSRFDLKSENKHVGHSFQNSPVLISNILLPEK